MTNSKDSHPAEKIAVLGGGIASLSAVYEMTNRPDWQNHYDITVYQLGWRLGGKGASGRNPDVAERIEEHGLHVWFGCYDNAFDLIQRAYAENKRPVGHPMATWREAFEPAHSFVCMEEVDGKWEKWPIQIPMNDREPGITGPIPNIWELTTQLIDLMVEKVLMAHVTNATGRLESITEAEQKSLEALYESALTFFKQFSKLLGIDAKDLSIYDAVRKIQEFLKDQQASGEFTFLLMGLKQCRKWLWDQVKKKIETSHTFRRLWILVDLISSNLIGMIEDKVMTEGFEVINDQDYRKWVAKHSLTPDLTANSAPIQAFYTFNFSGLHQHTYEAGTALMGALRLILTYKGAYYYRMMAGMGDVVFTPIYEVLKKRGVKFEFFSKVTDLNLTPDKTQIQSVQIARQVNLKGENYDPLVKIKGLNCWPSYPLYDQLAEGQALKDRKINLESWWSDWEDVGHYSLEKGKDFDRVLLGISIAALPHIAQELIEESPAWANMVSHVTTTATQAVQVWLKPGLGGLGWPYMNRGKPISGTFRVPFETNCDLTDLVPKENWPAAQQPGHLAYLCGKYDIEDYPDFSETNFPEEALQEVKDNTFQYLQQESKELWPKAHGPEGFDWDLLVDLEDRTGVDRMESLYFRVNVDPTERYVLSEAGNSHYRLKSDASGFSNLVITGDWIDNGFNAGCIEAAVISGKQAARTINGTSETIHGEYIPPYCPEKQTPKSGKGAWKGAAAILSFYKSLR